RQGALPRRRQSRAHARPPRAAGRDEAGDPERARRAGCRRTGKNVTDVKMKAGRPCAEPARSGDSMKFQRGGFVMGLIIGLMIGLAVALGVALYVTKVPVPFVNKVPQRTAEQDAAEAEKNKNWDPNSPLYGKNPARPNGSPPPPRGAV